MNKVAYVISIVFGLIWIYRGFFQYRLMFLHGPGGGLFPFVAGIIVVVFGGLLLVQTLIKERKAKGEKLFNVTNIAAAKIIGIAFLTALSVHLVGLTIALCISLFCWMKFFSKRPVLSSLLVSICTVAILYISFAILLRLPMPRGLLGII